MHTFWKYRMNVSDWSLERKDKQLKPLEKDQEHKKCKSLQEALPDQKPETFLLKVIQTQLKESERNWTQLLRPNAKWQVEPQQDRTEWKSKSPQDSLVWSSVREVKQSRESTQRQVLSCVWVKNNLEQKPERCWRFQELRIYVGLLSMRLIRSCRRGW